MKLGEETFDNFEVLGQHLLVEGIAGLAFPGFADHGIFQLLEIEINGNKTG